ncbi:hypothetical protein PV396_03235 [Streptomyces sp. ME02-8801-2C]|uniref:hypothetical protein n=1 Tax=Streptomyces sp. ME02-8801-2C TaxID=3028680 RepID=UPI0029BCB6FA|nr:hypothetical protein [Streptomyces sp. ME02-8801-2C]MDX3450967.1 hypothetical protein [Streptomyces sp. ME02-8801-2C]
MGQRPNLPEDFKSEARIAFAFLVETEGFAEPEEHDNRCFYGSELTYRRADLEVSVGFIWARPEHGVWTDLSLIGPDGTAGRSVSLYKAYVAAGCGPPQDVPGTVHNRRTMLMRVHQHAAALRRLLPQLPARFPDP